MKTHLSALHHHCHDLFPTSPHYLFENKKNYAQIKKYVDEAYDAEFEVKQRSKNLQSAIFPMGMNYHYFNYLASYYGELFKAIRNFEKILKKTIPELKAYYKDLRLPSSELIFSTMHEEMKSLLPLVEEENKQAVRRNPQHISWDACVIFTDQVASIFKESSKDKK